MRHPSAASPIAKDTAALNPGFCPAAGAGANAAQPAAFRGLGRRIKAFVRSHPRLYARLALLRDQYRERRHPTAEGKARAGYFQRQFDRESLGRWERRKRLLDFYRCRQCFGADEFDYVLYGFHRLSDAEKDGFVTNWNRFDYYRRLNRPENKSIFKNKDETYLHFGAYFRRELLHLQGLEDWPRFQTFCDRQTGFICKPRDSSCGKGIRIYPSVGPQSERQFQEILQQYAGGAIIEELIRQVPELAAFHPASVNTVRVPTLFLGDQVLIYHPFLRTGVGPSIVDNGGSGGILAGINPATGTVETAGRAQSGIYYEKHPDTGLVFWGFQLPQWTELLALADQLCRIVPTNRYTGWDFALTAQGWVLVEANDRGQFVGFQMMTGKGCQRELEAILSAHGL